LGAQGRVVIPAALRQAAGFKPGDTLIARVERDGRLVLETRESLLAGIQALFSHIPPGVSLAEELIAERRAEAAREEAELAEWIKKGHE
jgi:AbrB family looped-hinge helix DNA binding protein